MSEEKFEHHEEKCNCICHSKGFRKFVVIALGTFVGVFCALSLFAALHKPPMIMPCPCGCHGRMMPPPPMIQHRQFEDWENVNRENFHKKFPPRFEGKAPIAKPVIRVDK